MRETMPGCPDATSCAFAPDLAWEVLGPSTRRIDRNEKRAIHAREGGSRLLIVDPAVMMLGGFAIRDGRRVLLATLADDTRVTLQPVGAFGSL